MAQAKAEPKAVETPLVAKDVTIQRSKEVLQIVIPEKMPLMEAAKWLERKHQEEGKEVALRYEIDAFPLDGAVAFRAALDELYGFVSSTDTPGWFGPKPPVMVGVPTGVNELVRVPWGRVMIPGVDGYLTTEMLVDPFPKFMIAGVTLQRHLPEVEAIVAKTKELLERQSIYKGKAIRLDLEWLRKRQDFSPTGHAPQFTIDIAKVREDELVFAAKVQNDIELGLFTPIEQAEHCRRHKIPLKRGVLLAGDYGVGKCLAKNTPVLMFDGAIKMVQDVKPDELLMGPDSTARRVLSIARGRDKMYRVTPRKGDSYVVNAAHILSLKVTSEWCAGKYGPTGSIVNMNVQDYAALPDFVRQGLAGWRAGVNFAAQEVKIDPYFVGLWLGDGDSRNPAITTADAEIEQYIREVAASYNLMIREHTPSGENNLSMTYHLTAGNSQKGYPEGVSRNPVRAILQEYNLLQNKHIPDVFKANSREVRLRLLAGLVDSDGHNSNNCLEIATKFDALADDILFLCRSLGFAAYKSRKAVKLPSGESRSYWRLSISGELSEIPTKLAHKQFTPRQQPKNVLVSRLAVEELPEDDYYGFAIDGDHLFMLGDFTVTHNTLTAYVTAKKAVAHGWTFIYLASVQDLALAFQFAKQYAPAVIFAEDVDRVVGQDERTEAIDAVLNAFDGVDTKGLEVITVLTTNHLETLTQAILRPGRCDTLVQVTRPDAAAAIRLVKLYGRDLIADNADYERIGEALANHLPAEIREATERAKLAAINRMAKASGTGWNGSIQGYVTEEDVLAAVHAMHAQHRLLEPKERDPRSIAERCADVLGGRIAEAVANGVNQSAALAVNMLQQLGLKDNDIGMAYNTLTSDDDLPDLLANGASR